MKKKNQICLLFVAFLLLKGTCMYAQGNLSDRYAWRLDSVVGSMPVFPAMTDSTPVKPDWYAQYTYDANSVTVLSGLRVLWHDTMTFIYPRKDVYTWAVDSGLYLKEMYNGEYTGGELVGNFNTYPNERKLVMKLPTNSPSV